jgi:hypothetical protein
MSDRTFSALLVAVVVFAAWMLVVYWLLGRFVP